MASKSIEVHELPPELHAIFANERRLLAIEALQAANGELSLKELAARVAAAEADDPQPPEKLMNSVYISLLQTHLDRLEDADFIDYDANTKVVELKTDTRSRDVVTEVVPRFGLAWSEVYLGLALLGLGTIGGSWLGTPGFAVLEPATWAGVFLIGLFGTAMYRTEAQGSSLGSRLSREL